MMDGNNTTEGKPGDAGNDKSGRPLSASELASLISALATGVYIAFFTPLSNISKDRTARYFSMLFLLMSVFYYFFTAWYIQDNLNAKLRTIRYARLEWWLRVLGILAIYSVLFTIQMESYSIFGLPIFVYSFIVLYVIYFLWDFVVREIGEIAKFVWTDLLSLLFMIIFIVSYFISDDVWKNILLGVSWMGFILVFRIGKDMFPKNLWQKLANRSEQC